MGGFFIIRAMEFPNKQRAVTALYPSLRGIVASRPLVDIASATSNWSGDSSGLCADMAKNFAGPCRKRYLSITSFFREADHYTGRKNGSDFETKYPDISVGRNSARKVVRHRRPKDSLRKFYTSTPTVVDFLPLT